VQIVLALGAVIVILASLLRSIFARLDQVAVTERLTRSIGLSSLSITMVTAIVLFKVILPS
jgi:hypothetical protein